MKVEVDIDYENKRAERWYQFAADKEWRTDEIFAHALTHTEAYAWSDTKWFNSTQFGLRLV